jgi:hypothetical protein
VCVCERERYASLITVLSTAREMKARGISWVVLVLGREIKQNIGLISTFGNVVCLCSHQTCHDMICSKNCLRT